MLLSQWRLFPIAPFRTQSCNSLQTTDDTSNITTEYTQPVHNEAHNIYWCLFTFTLYSIMFLYSLSFSEELHKRKHTIICKGWRPPASVEEAPCEFCASVNVLMDAIISQSVFLIMVSRSYELKKQSQQETLSLLYPKLFLYVTRGNRVSYRARRDTWTEVVRRRLMDDTSLRTEFPQRRHGLCRDWSRAKCRCFKLLKNACTWSSSSRFDCYLTARRACSECNFIIPHRSVWFGVNTQQPCCEKQKQLTCLIRTICLWCDCLNWQLPGNINKANQTWCPNNIKHWLYMKFWRQYTSSNLFISSDVEELHVDDVQGWCGPEEVESLAS